MSSWRDGSDKKGFYVPQPTANFEGLGRGRFLSSGTSEGVGSETSEGWQVLGKVGGATRNGNGQAMDQKEEAEVKKEEWPAVGLRQDEPGHKYVGRGRGTVVVTKTGVWAKPVQTSSAFRENHAEEMPKLAGLKVDDDQKPEKAGVSAWARGSPMKFQSAGQEAPAPRPLEPVAAFQPVRTPTATSTASTSAHVAAQRSTSYGAQRSSSSSYTHQRHSGRTLPPSEYKDDDKKRMYLIEHQALQSDTVMSRGKDLHTKKGISGKSTVFLSNYYPLEKLMDFNLFKYHVEYFPNEERTELRKKMMGVHDKTLKVFIFDGQSLYTPHRIDAKLALCSENPGTKNITEIRLKLVAEIAPYFQESLQVYNIMFRNILTQLGFQIMGRFHYDPSRKTEIPSRRLEVWPGYITSVRNHENQILLNVEVTHKVVRSDTVLEYIRTLLKESPEQYARKTVEKSLLGSIVATAYNKKTYKVDDIKWDVSPKDSFKNKQQGTCTKYMDYYKQIYGITIQDIGQPMLVSNPKKKDFHRGCTQPIFLIPELCQMTGLNDAMRKDVKLMKDMATHVTLSPVVRMEKANELIERWYSNPEIVSLLNEWNVGVGKTPIQCTGRVLDMEKLQVQGRRNQAEYVGQDRPGFWADLFRDDFVMLKTVKLMKWVLLCQDKHKELAKQMLTSIKLNAKKMNFAITDPMIHLIDSRVPFWKSTQDFFTKVESTQMQIQMVMVVLPNNNADIYNMIKRRCYHDLGLPSQCVIAWTLQSKGMACITSRLAIQMNAKLGGVPWSLRVPSTAKLMVVGYDVFHSPKKDSVGALVASTSDNLGRYFTSTSFHKCRSELSSNLCQQMTNALRTYCKLNHKLPDRIFLYRDGVGDGQLEYIYGTELAQVQEAINSIYTENNQNKAKLSFIVVTKRIHTRIFRPAMTPRIENAPPGSIVDDVITLPERYDFFLVSQAVPGRGTVSPTSYNVLFDEQGLVPDQMQQFTLKMCHLYYNYTGTIAVPAQCQFAHKLAFITGTALVSEAHQSLVNSLYFL